MQLIDELRREDEILAERFTLCAERIQEIAQESLADQAANVCFQDMARLIDCILDYMDEPQLLIPEQLKWQKSHQTMIYERLTDGHYEQCYCNPTYARNMLGKDYGKLLSILYSEVMGLPVYIKQKRYFEATILMELFLEIYGMFMFEEKPSPAQLQKTIYWYLSDYFEELLDIQMGLEFIPRQSYMKKIVMESNTDLQTYLYTYGFCISAKERFLQSHMAFEDEAAVMAHAQSLAESFIESHPEKGNVRLLYEIGCERVTGCVARILEEKGYEVIICCDSQHILMRACPDEFSVIPEVNEQYTEDHWQDIDLFMNKSFMEHRKIVYKTVTDKYAAARAKYIGTLACSYPLI